MFLSGRKASAMPEIHGSNERRESQAEGKLMDTSLLVDDCHQMDHFYDSHQTRPSLAPRFQTLESGRFKQDTKHTKNVAKMNDLKVTKNDRSEIFVQASDASAMALAATLAQKQLMEKMKGCSIGNRPLLSSLAIPSRVV